MQSVVQRRVAASQGLPHIEGQSLTTYNRQSPNGTLSLLTPAPGAPLEYALFQDGLTSSWQLDLFGRVRRAVEAPDANTLAAVGTPPCPPPAAGPPPTPTYPLLPPIPHPSPPRQR